MFGRVFKSEKRLERKFSKEDSSSDLSRRHKRSRLVKADSDKLPENFTLKSEFGLETTWQIFRYNMCIL